MMDSQIQFFCPHWGSESLPFKTFLKKVKTAGYDGIEMSLPLQVQKRNHIVSSIKGEGLLLIAQHWETIDKDVNTHLANFKTRLQNLAAGSPLFINSQTGKDYFTIEQNALLIKAATEIATESGISIIHETHRGKFAFAAHITEKYLATFPAMQLCLDISHWCCVAETLLEDQAEAVSKAIANTRHIHSRVGFTQGPQVMDARAPEWAAIIEKHITWWQQVVNKNSMAGLPTTITTEFGPFPYLQHLPYTKTPVYDQWEVNMYMKNLLQARLVRLKQ